MTDMERAFKFDAALQSLCKPGPATLWLEGVADEVLAMRVPRRSAALRAEPVTLSQAKAAAAIASEIERLILAHCFSRDDEQIEGADFAAEAILRAMQ